MNRLADKMEKERNGAPIDPEIAARMTQPSDHPRYQVYVLMHGKPTPVGPRASQDVIENFAATIRQQIAAGKEKHWSEPLVVRI